MNSIELYLLNYGGEYSVKYQVEAPPPEYLILIKEVLTKVFSVEPSILKLARIYKIIKRKKK